jgi:hypothetical protein
MKFKIGDKVLYYGRVYTIKEIPILTDIYGIENNSDKTGASETELTPYIEQDTKEETTEDKTIKIDIPPQKLLVKSEVSGLDYEKEYKLLLEEYEELNEELYIAKTAIKMLSELP